MKRTLLASAAAIALIAGMNAVSAQTSGGEQQQHMQNAPSGNTAPRGEETVKPGVHPNEPGAVVQNEQKDKMSQTQNEAQPRREGQMGPTDQTNPRGGNEEKMGRDQDHAQGQVQDQGQMEQKARTTQQGQGPAKSVQLSSEQREKIHAILSDHKAERIAHVDFTVNVGARVPRTVRLYPLPIDIVEITPEYRGYDYVLVGDEILIIDPNTLEIVAVLPA
jgi:hypothetical protein